MSLSVAKESRRGELHDHVQMDVEVSCGRGYECVRGTAGRKRIQVGGTSLELPLEEGKHSVRKPKLPQLPLVGHDKRTLEDEPPRSNIPI